MGAGRPFPHRRRRGLRNSRAPELVEDHGAVGEAVGDVLGAVAAGGSGGVELSGGVADDEVVEAELVDDEARGGGGGHGGLLLGGLIGLPLLVDADGLDGIALGVEDVVGTELARVGEHPAGSASETDHEGVAGVDGAVLELVRAAGGVDFVGAGAATAGLDGDTHGGLRAARNELMYLQIAPRMDPCQARLHRRC